MCESEGEEDYDEDITASLTSEMEEGIDEEEEVQPPPPPKRKRQHNTHVEAIPIASKTPAKRRRLQLPATNGKTAPPAAPPPRATGPALTVAGRKRKTTSGDVESAGKMEKWDPPKITTTSSKIRDFSQPLARLNTDKFLLGSRHTVQVGQVHYEGTRTFGFEALILTREPPKNPIGNQPAKAFRFNMPATLIRPLFNALIEILGNVSHVEPAVLDCSQGG